MVQFIKKYVAEDEIELVPVIISISGTSDTMNIATETTTQIGT